ncbi:MAG: hypothetical protein RQ839_04735 [Thermoproteus sp.]|nr:hypothetical protein [Thermoproteus sp.]MDT7882017.1 hypothetical protein [Thermoproteus sp.]
MEVAEGGGEAGSLGLEGLGSDGRLVRAMGGGGPARGGQGGRTPPRIQIAEVDGMRSGYTMAYGRYGAATRPRASP